MLFTKIRQTIAALKTPPAKRTIQNEIDEHGKVLEESMSGKTPQKVVTLGVYLVVIIPSSFLIIEILHRLTQVNEKALGVIGIIVALASRFIMNWFHDELIGRIPLHKFSPYFGSKIDETISAFKKSR